MLLRLVPAATTKIKKMIIQTKNVRTLGQKIREWLKKTIQDRYNPIKAYKFLKKEGFKNPSWKTICCLVGRLNSNLDWVDNRLFSFLGLRCYGSKLFQAGFHLGWNPESFLKMAWSKTIIVDPINGHHLYDADKFSEKEKALCKELDLETEEVSEHRSLYLYSFWIIDSWYKYSAPDQRIVEVVDGDEQIETHHFTGGVRRRKLPWWNSYRVKERWSDDMTQFDKDYDDYQRSISEPWGSDD